LTRLVIATSNRGKIAEIEDLVCGMGFAVIGLSDLPARVDIVEDADNFEGNARKKAIAVARAAGCPALSDDSGLCVDALDGRPGVHSARYGGPGLTDGDRNRRLLEELTGVNEDRRTAAFHCAIAFSQPDGDIRTFNGILRGRISFSPRGDSGFGYDPVFIPNGFDCTLAELGMDVKQRISHRAAALSQFAQWIRTPGT